MVKWSNSQGIFLILGCIWYASVGGKQVTLLTTEGITTDLKWKVENRYGPPDFTGWEDLSLLLMDKIVRGYQVCQINVDSNMKEKPQAWLILPEVNVNGASRIFIEMNFTMRECSDLEKTCRETFSVYYRLTNADTTEEFDPSYFKKIDTVAAEVRFSSVEPNTLVNSEIVTVGLNNSTLDTALQIAIVDAGACMALMGVKIYHKVCEETVTGFASFQQTMTGVSDTSLVPVTGTCVSNSKYSESSFTSAHVAPPSTTFEPATKDLIGPLYRCTSSGDWQVPTGSCQCEPGFEPDLSGQNCEPCAIGYYKPLSGNENCTSCPFHSGTEYIGAKTCQCDLGYQFIRMIPDDNLKIGFDPALPLTDEENTRECDLCSKLPTPPTSLRIEQIKENDPGFIKISWKRPEDDGGCFDIQYCILCQYVSMVDVNSSSEDYQNCDQLHFKPSSCGINSFKVTVNDLRGHTTYNFSVISHSIATKQRFSGLMKSFTGKEINYTFLESGRNNSENLQTLLRLSSLSLVHTTGDTLPTSVQNPMITMENNTAVYVKWTEPGNTNGKILYYKVKYNLQYESTDDTEPSSSPARYVSSSDMWEERKVNGTAVLLTDLYPGSTYQIVIIAHNSAGSDNGSIPLLAYTVAMNDLTDGRPTETDTFPYLIATIVIATLVFIICLILILQWKCRNNKKSKLQTTTEQPTEFRPYNSHHETLDQRTYVDPFSLDSMPPHRFLCETSVESILCSHVIGCGEFGEVYKGTLATIDLNTGQETTIDVAVKKLRDECEPQEQINFLREALSLEKFRHPNIVHLEAVVTKSRPFFIVTELMVNGCLHGFLTRIKERSETMQNGHGWTPLISHITMANMLRGVTSGMDYLSERGFVHRDLAARNVLVNSDLTCKVADFGLMREVESTDSEGGSNGSATYTTRGGKIAIRWTAPEAIGYRTFTQFSDVWSFGILMWEAASFGEKPYWDLTNREVVKAVSDGLRLPAPEKCPSVFHQLMLECWQRDIHKRPTFSRIISRFDEMISKPDLLEVPASPASCGVQEMFFGNEEQVTVVDINEAEEENPPISDQEENSSQPVLDYINREYDESTNQVEENEFESTNQLQDEDEYELTNLDEDTGSEVSSCTSTICASEITVYAGNGAAVYVPLLRSDSDEIRPGTPVGNYYSWPRKASVA